MGRVTESQEVNTMSTIADPILQKKAVVCTRLSLSARTLEGMVTPTA
jgi:hypothetical protein